MGGKKRIFSGWDVPETWLDSLEAERDSIWGTVCMRHKHSCMAFRGKGVRVSV